MPRRSKKPESKELASVLDTLGFFWSIPRFLLLTPYKYERKRRALSFTNGVFRRLTYIMGACSVISYTGFLIWRCAVAARRGAAIANMQQLYYFIAAPGTLTVGFYLHYVHWGRHHFVFNALMDFVVKFNDKYTIRTNLKTLGLTIKILGFVYLFGVFTSPFIVLKSPSRLRFLTSLFPEPSELSLWTKLGFVFLHCYINAAAYHLVVYNLGILFCYAFLIKPIIGALRMQQNNTRNSMDPEEVRSYAQQILTLQAEFTMVYGPWIQLVVAWLILFTTTSLFQLVVFGYLRGIVYVSIFMTLLVEVSTKCGQMYETSEKTRGLWAMDSKAPLWFVKFRRSWRGARVPIGSFFYFDRGVVMTFVNIVITSGVNMIVAHREREN